MDKDIAVKTSETDPIYVNFIEHPVLDSLEGRLGITFAPGKQAWGGIVNIQWQRDLRLDLTRLREVFSTDILVSLIEDEEFEWLNINNLPKMAEEFGIRFWHFPIVDDSVPSDMDDAMKLVEKMIKAISENKTVVVHCRGGLGRAGTIAACVLVALGISPEEAISIVRQTRSRAIRKQVQEDFLFRFDTYLK